jgi:hypothetical protein
MAEEPEENGKQKRPEERQGEVDKLEGSARSGPRISTFSEAQGNMDKWIETQRTPNDTSDNTSPSRPRSLPRPVEGACFIKQAAYSVDGIDWIV